MNSFIISIALSVIIFVVIAVFQKNAFCETKKYRRMFNDFFKRNGNYATYTKVLGEESVLQLADVGEEDSDLSGLIKEINHYIAKTKGTTDFSVIQNKVERKLNMRYDQATAQMAFPTYLGLMGTFAGVCAGILMFILGFDGAGNISDNSIKNLLLGVLVSMSTSLLGLILTTRSNFNAGNARKKIEEDKNEFYDFVQTEIMPSLDVSMVTAITKLHETVDRFEPSFDRIINSFQLTFDRCTAAFGDRFETNVRAVALAVEAMGNNMDKINENIALQRRLIETMQSGELVRGMEKYIEATDHFVDITKSLNKFEQARKMMLAAAQEAIVLQNQYSESLKIPREVAVRINQILDRIKDFEKDINGLGTSLARREILGNDVLNAIRDQINAIGKKNKIAEKFFGIADGKLEKLYEIQTKVIDEMNSRYKAAIEGHIEGFEQMITAHTDELNSRHERFVSSLEEKFNAEDVRQEFTNLRKLEQITSLLTDIQDNNVSSEDVRNAIGKVESELNALKLELQEINKNTKNNSKGGFSLFGRNDK